MGSRSISSDWCSNRSVLVPIHCHRPGTSGVIVTGTSKDAKRLEVAKKLGADYTINVEEEDPVTRIAEITGGEGVDVALDCTAGAGTAPLLLGLEALKRKGGTLLVQQEVHHLVGGPGGVRFFREELLD